jgi:hypothetical protein
MTEGRPFPGAGQTLGEGGRQPETRHVFATFDYTSFFSVWYWVLTVATWAQVCHRTLGVPYDMILRAERLPAVAAEVDAMAAIGAARVAAIHRAVGAWLAGIGGFVLAGLGFLGFAAGVEAAQAALILLAPLAVVTVQTARLAIHVEATGARGAELRRRLARRRAWNQTIAIAATVTAAVVALAHHPGAVLLRP